MHSDIKYTVGWICAISTEYIAAQEFLDEEHERPQYVPPDDNNDYTLGRIGNHNVVIAVLPKGQYGVTNAATVARDMVRTFSDIRIGLMVGVGGGAPSKRHDIRLGDVVVSATTGDGGAVFQYDFGKTIQDQSFQFTGFLNQPPTVLQNAVHGLETHYRRRGHEIQDAIADKLEKNRKLRKTFKRPCATTDRLYRSDIVHNETSCCSIATDADGSLVLRSPRDEDEDDPVIHYGLIASGNALMKDAGVRDKLSEEKDVLCFEMEAAGLMNNFPCLVIRGICDYSDSHKNKEWQGYAAMTAAAYAKDLLCRVAANQVEASATIKSLLADITEIKENIGCLVRKEHDDEHDENLEWLTSTDYSAQQNDVFRQRNAGTGQWLIDSPEYRNWVDTKQGTLFCPGIPGAGKTVLASLVVNDLIARSRHEPTIGIAYIYFNYKQGGDQHVDGLMLSLLKQFARPKHARAIIQDMHDRHNVQKTRPTSNEIYQTLLSVASAYSRLFIVIDALDECQSSNGCRGSFLSEACRFQATSAANLLVTSRPIMAIEDSFKECPKLEIRATEADICKYLDAQMQRLSKRFHSDMKIQNEIKVRISVAVEGMFLLAKFHFDSLIGKDTPWDIRKALENLATGEHAYEAVYESTMHRIRGQISDHKDRALRVLSWITCARRPLRTAELQHALAVGPGDTTLEADKILIEEDMVSVCAGLVIIDKESAIIRLVHYTAQEYLSDTQSEWFPNAEDQITMTILTYLSFDAFDTKESEPIVDAELEALLRPYYLYEYAAGHWADHARTLSDCSGIVSFLRRNPQMNTLSRFLHWELEVIPYVSYSHDEVPDDVEVTGLHIAAYRGLTEAICLLLDTCTNPKACLLFRSPLWYSAYNSQTETAQLLVAKGAEVNHVTNYGGTPLSIAAERGHQGIVQLLLRNGTMADLPNQRAETPLLVAFCEGHTEIVQLLLEHSLHVDRRDGHDGTQLVLAAKRGLIGLVQLLLDRGTTRNVSNGSGEMALSYAAQGGHEDVVRLLLESGADPEMIDSSGLTPLSHAAHGGHENMVQLLLQHPVDPDPVTQFSARPLWRALEKGNDSVVELLISRGVDIERLDQDGFTLLTQAARLGLLEPAQLLLKYGADLEAAFVVSTTPLLQAVTYGHDKVAWLLLENGANTECADVDGQMPLFASAGSGHVDTVRVLLEYGANPEARNRTGETPLFRAAAKGHVAVVQLLLDNGANVESANHMGWTPLFVAVLKGKRREGKAVKVVRILLEHGADPKAGNSEYRQTPLEVAIANKSYHIGRLLRNEIYTSGEAASTSVREDTETI